MIARVTFGSFFEDGGHVGNTPILWNSAFLQRFIKNQSQVSALFFKNRDAILSGPGVEFGLNFINFFSLVLWLLICHSEHVVPVASPLWALHWVAP